MKFYELVFNEENPEMGVDLISLVESPAIESNFVALKDEEQIKVEFKAIDEEQRILLGPALIPNKPIFRAEGEDEFYVFFSKETIRKAAEHYMVNLRQAKANLEHSQGVDGVVVVESWIVEDPEKDKSAIYGKQKEGTWMVAMKVYNDEVWNSYVKEGKVKGFSIEGWFSPKKTQMQLSKEQPKDEWDEVYERVLQLIKEGVKWENKGARNTQGERQYQVADQQGAACAKMVKNTALSAVGMRFLAKV